MQAQERACVRQPAPSLQPTAEERDFQGWITARKRFGFRHGAAYVRRLAERGRFAVYGFPATKREIDYLWLRADLTVGPRGERYLKAHAGVDGGLSVEDDWPREPYLLARFTRDVSRHLAALKQRSPMPDNLRAKRVTYSQQALSRAQDRVGRDDDALEAAGFHVQSTGHDISRNVVVVDLATRRTDARAYFAQRYGRRVKPVVRAKDPTVVECATAVTFERSPDPQTLTIGYDSGGGATFERLELTETADQVEVGVVERASSGPRTADYERGRTTITLASPLGDRPVIDARSGRRVRQTGPTPGDPACPRFNPPRGETYTRAEEELLIADNPAVDDYLRRHDDVYGGSTIEGGNRPYIVFGFTRDRARHEREIERRSRLRPSQIRTRTVAHTLDALVETARRIRADTAAGSGFLDGYGRAGFFIIDVAIEGQAVTVHVVATRPDHAAWFTARYGPLVHTIVVGDRFECAAPQP